VRNRIFHVGVGTHNLLQSPNAWVREESRVGFYGERSWKQDEIQLHEEWIFDAEANDYATKRRSGMRNREEKKPNVQSSGKKGGERT